MEDYQWENLEIIGHLNLEIQEVLLGKYKENLDKVFYTKNGFKKFENEEYVQMGKEAGFRHISITTLGNKYGLLIEYIK